MLRLFEDELIITCVKNNETMISDGFYLHSSKSKWFFCQTAVWLHETRLYEIKLFHIFYLNLFKLFFWLLTYRHKQQKTYCFL